MLGIVDVSLKKGDEYEIHKSYLQKSSETVRKMKNVFFTASHSSTIT